jgi:hypothetical protein
MMTLRQKMEAMFSGEMIQEQRRLMGLDFEMPLRESNLPLRARYGFTPKLVEDSESDDSVDTALHHTELAHERSRAAHQAGSWNPSLPPNYVAHMHTQARDAHNTAHTHWKHIAKSHSDMHVRSHAADLAKEHGDARDSHHARSAPAEPKPEPEVYVRRKSA